MFASLSTRNGVEQYYWKPLSGLSKKVALSALETHGSVERLLAGESRSPLCEVEALASSVEKVRSVFVRLLGVEVVAEFHSTEASPIDATDPESSILAPLAQGAGGVKLEMSAEGKSAVGQKRKARMEMVDDLKQSTGSSKEDCKRTKPV